MYCLYHETSFKNLENIFRSRKLYKSSILSEKINRSQGSSKRKLTKDPTVSLTNDKFYELYDEVDAVYFRLSKTNEKILLKFNNVVLYFKSYILKEYSTVINTEENFGFLISESGEIGKSQFSGETGISIYNLKNLNTLKTFQFDSQNSEVAILDSVNLKYLIKVVIKKKYKRIFKKNKFLITFCKKKNIIVQFL